MIKQQPNFTATLKDEQTIEVAVRKSFDSPLVSSMRLLGDGKTLSGLKLLSRSESKSTFIYTFGLKDKIVCGILYELADGRNECAPLDISYLASLDSFDEEFRYDGELGAIYNKEATSFAVFAPLASEVIIGLYQGGKKSYIPLERQKCGVYIGRGEGDLDGAEYIIIARINGEYAVTADPYAKSLGPNSRFGYIVDMHKIEDIPLNDESLPPFNDYCAASIYELDVRDMTSLTGLDNKGTYNALAQEGLKDKNGNPLGLDYIASLGVSHVQLLPVFDFQTISDEKPSTSYNWGYDPIYYFAPEGSYSSDPADPYKRMRELRNLVGAFHKKGIRVNMDVVFNHTFQFVTSALNILCPNYYYRLDKDGNPANGTGCGNELESRRYMMRKLIVDALSHFAKYYGMDGFRFDLMGLIDRQTMLNAYFNLKGMKPSLMMYGEGWDMPSMLPTMEKSSMNNAALLPDIGFFNDRFRDIVRGRSFGDDIASKGYLSGDGAYRDGFKHVFMGSSVAFAFPPLFNAPKQSVNYVECHDGLTLFDKLKACLPEEKEDALLKRASLINVLEIFAFGVPFIHAGQEIGLSKKGKSNTYNDGDDANGFDWKKEESRYWMVSLLKDAIRCKEKYPFLRWNKAGVIEKQINFLNLENGSLEVVYANENLMDKARLFINVGFGEMRIIIDKDYKLVFDAAGLKEPGLKTSSEMNIQPFSLALFVKGE